MTIEAVDDAFTHTININNNGYLKYKMDWSDIGCLIQQFFLFKSVKKKLYNEMRDI